MSEKNKILLYIFLLHIVGVVYCAILIIYRPLGYNWGIASVGIVFGIPNMLYLLYLMISQLINEKRELNKKYILPRSKYCQ
jgi:hypothetical protein